MSLSDVLADIRNLGGNTMETPSIALFGTLSNVNPVKTFVALNTSSENFCTKNCVIINSL